MVTNTELFLAFCDKASDSVTYVWNYSSGPGVTCNHTWFATMLKRKSYCADCFVNIGSIKTWRLSEWQPVKPILMYYCTAYTIEKSDFINIF